MTEHTQVSDATFGPEVLQAAGLVLVEFGADWCRPCRMLDPIVDELAAEWRGRVKVAKMDIDENVDTTVRFGVMSVPTLILFLHGQPLERVTGFVPKKRIVDAFGPHLPTISAAA
ncbi:MAG: thioredoxin domain-containing protein [Anaerolineales bacterium]